MLELKKIALNLEDEEGKVEVLKGIDLRLEKKKIYVMTGPNGGGKSSIAKIIMGIYQPTAGEIILDGEEITSLGISERAKAGIGYAFQQPPRFKGLRVREILDLAAGFESTANRYDLLYNVGLCAQDYMEREINASFSGGELKRIEIASILARKLKVAVFDEPEAGIDLWSFQRLTETFQKMHQEQDTAILIISHQERILRLADEVILVEEGQIKEITDKEKFFSDIAQLDKECRCHMDCYKGV